MDDRNGSQNLINLNIGQLLNLLDNVNKNYERKFEKLKKSFVNNKYGIYIYIFLRVNFITDNEILKAHTVARS